MIGQLGTLVHISGTVFGIFEVRCWGSFFWASHFRRANALGAFLGSVAGTLVAIGVAFSKQLFDRELSFLWIGLARRRSPLSSAALSATSGNRRARLNSHWSIVQGQVQANELEALLGEGRPRAKIPWPGLFLFEARCTS